MGVTLDKNLNFKSHVNQLCRISGQKLHALARISNYMDIDKLKIMMNTLIISQFSYCPLMWMFHDRSVNKNIDRIHERAPRIAYKDSYSSYEDLLRKTESVTIHQRNLELLAIEIYKTQNNHNPSFMKQIFVMKDIPYHLRSCKNILAPIPRTIGYGIESARFLGSRIWHALPSSIRVPDTQ